MDRIGSIWARPLFALYGAISRSMFPGMNQSRPFPNFLPGILQTSIMNDPKLMITAAIVSLLTSPFVYIFMDGWPAVYIGFFFMVLGIFLFLKATKASKKNAEKKEE